MTILISADWHLSENDRDAYRFRFQLWLRDYIRSHNIGGVYILGDLTEQKDRHSAVLVNSVIDHLYKLCLLCPVTILCGNHDRADADRPFFEFSKRLPNIDWINTPRRIGNWTFLPHTDHYETDWKGWLDKPGATYFCHATFDGATERGIKYRGIPTSIFLKKSLIYSGDIHTPQKAGPVTYVGAPYRIDFGDDYEPRVIVLNGRSEPEINVPVPGPQKRLIVWGVNQSEAKAGDVLKVRVTFSPENSGAWWKTRDKINAWGEKVGCAIDSIEPIVEYDGRARIVPERAAAVDDAELMKSYAKRQGLDARTLKVGMGLLGDEHD